MIRRALKEVLGLLLKELNLSTHESSTVHLVTTDITAV
jgi:hypothetical protein